MYRRIISLLLIVVMLFSLCSNIFALDGDPAEATISSGGETMTRDQTDEIMANGVVSIDSFFAQLISGATQDGDRYIWTPGASPAGHKYTFRVVYSTSGTGEIGPGEFEIRIPKSILIDRDGEYADEIGLSVPSVEELEIVGGSSELEQVDLVYREDNDCFVVYNYKQISAAMNGYLEISYLQTKTTFDYPDMGENTPFQAFATLRDLEAETDQIKVYMNTHANIIKTEKRFPTEVDHWLQAWGEAPEDADDYIYLYWDIRTLIEDNVTQPYDFTLEDEIISSTAGPVDIVGYKLWPRSEFSMDNTIQGVITGGQRYDAVITRHRKDEVEDLSAYKIVNKEIATVHPVDGIDPDTSSTSQKTFTWKLPVFEAPTGSFYAHKRADGDYRKQNDPKKSSLEDLGNHAGNYSRYDLNDFKAGDLTELNDLDYAVWAEGYPYPWTLEDGANPLDPSSYGKVPVKFVLTDEEVRLDVDGEQENAESDILTCDDYQIDTLAWNWEMKNGYFNAKTMKFTGGSPVYKDYEYIDIYGRFGHDDEWKLMAKYHLIDKTLWTDTQYVPDYETIPDTNGYKFQLADNCVAFKMETENAHYYTRLNAVPNLKLKNSELVMNYIQDKNSVGILNYSRGNFYDRNGEELVEITERDWDFARVTQLDSYISKKVVSSRNSAKQKSYIISWKVRAEELATMGEGQKEYIPQSGGVFYDLLPEGAILDTNSIIIQGKKPKQSDLEGQDGEDNGQSGQTTKTGKDKDGYYTNKNVYSVKQYLNYKGSGRTLVVFNVKVEDDFYNLYFDTIHPWEAIRDYGYEVYNPVAYETNNKQITYGYPDNGGIANTEDDIIWNDVDVFVNHPKFQEYMSDLDPLTDDPKFIYAQEYYDINAITAASAGLTKRVMSIRDTTWEYDTWTTLNENYSYRLRLMNSFTSKTKDLIFFDTLENFKKDATKPSDWHGIFKSVDISQALSKGIDVKVYYSDVEGLDMEGETDGKQNNDITNEAVWHLSTTVPEEFEVKAIAIDMSTNIDGTPYVMDPGESVMAVVHLVAPAGAEPANPEDQYPETYNNVYVKDTVIDILGNEIPFFIHQDYTTVRFVVTADIGLKKVNEENERETIPDIQFRLVGTSDYGTAVDQIETTDTFGRISFEKIEKGHYVLQEYETTPDWLYNNKQYDVVIDQTGQVLVDGNPSELLVVTNKPRVHNDVNFIKIPEIFGTEQDEEEEQEDVIRIQAEPSVDLVGIPNVTFKLYGTSDYGTEVLETATSYQSGRVRFPNIEMGTYTLEEVVTHQDFLKNTTKWRVLVDENANVSILEPIEEEDKDRLSAVTKTGRYPQIQNAYRYWNFKLYKVDAYNSSIYLEGATFQVVGVSDFGTEYDITATTNAQGYIQFMNLEKGSYIIRELTAPTGVDEHGQLGGNRNYILDPQAHVMTIDEQGYVTIEGAVVTEIGEWAIQNDRAMDGTITVTKIWDDYGRENRPIPKLHLSTKEIGVNRNVNIKLNWTGEGDAPETRPNSVKIYIGTEDGTVIADKTFNLVNPENPTDVRMQALLDPNITYYVWADNPNGYSSLNSVDNKAQISTASGPEASITFEKLPPTVLVAGSTFKSRVPTDITSFQKSEAPPPDDVEPILLSTPTSGLPVYGWKGGEEGTDFYWYSDADTVYMNASSNNMFEGKTALKTIDLSDFDASSVTSLQNTFHDCKALQSINMDGMHFPNLTSLYGTFYTCNSLKDLDVSVFDTSKVTSFTQTFCGCSALDTLDVSGFDTSSATSMASMFYGCKAHELDVSGFDTSKVRTMSDMFRGCSNVTTLDVSGFDTSKVTSMTNMFYGCSNLETADVSGFDTSNVTNLRDMFFGCSKLSVIDVSNWNTSKVTNMYGVFQGSGVKNLDLSRWNTSKTVDMTRLVLNCQKLESIKLDNFDTTNVTDMSWMFWRCYALKELDVSMFNTSKVKTMRMMFSNCTSLKELDIRNFDTSKVTDMYGMFECLGCSELDLSHFSTVSCNTMAEMFNGCKMKYLDLRAFDTSKVTSFNRMLRGPSLEWVDLSSFDTTKVTNTSQMFDGCKNLENIYVSERWNMDGVTNSSGMFYNMSTKLPNYELNTGKPVDKTLAHYNEGGYLTYKAYTPLEPSEITNSVSAITTRRNMVFEQETEPEDVRKPIKTAGEVVRPMAEGDPDIASGVFDGVDWKITADGNLIIGKEGETQSFTYKTSRSSSTHPWNSFKSKVTGSISFAGPVIGSGDLNGLFMSFTNATSFDGTNFDTSGITTFSYFFNGNTKMKVINVSGFDTSSATSLSSMFNNCKVVEELDLSNFDTSNVTSLDSTFYHCDALKTLDLSNFNYEKVTTMHNLLSYCVAMTSVDFGTSPTPRLTSLKNAFEHMYNCKLYDLSHFTTGNVTDMDSMFEYNQSGATILCGGWDVSKVKNFHRAFRCNAVQIDTTGWVTSSATDMSEMFTWAQCESLDVSGFDTSHVTSFASMFSGCNNLKNLDVSNFDTSSATTMASMFQSCSALKDLDVTHFNTEKVTTMASVFQGCSGLSSLDVSNFNTEKVTSMASMFQGCSGLLSLDVSNFNTEKVKSMASMFQGCSKVPELILTNFNTSIVTSMASMFSGCSKLTKVDVSSFDTNNVTSMAGMFNGCTILPELDLSNFRTPKLTAFTNAFQNCKAIKDLDLTMLDVSHVTSLQSTFDGMTALENLDVSTWNTASLKTMTNMMPGCTSLKNLDLSSFDTSKIVNMMYMLSGSKIEGTLNVSSFKQTHIQRSGLGQTFGLKNAPQVIIFSDEMNMNPTGLKPGVMYVKKADSSGRRLYDQTPINGNNFLNMGGTELGGKWVRTGYLPHNDLGDGDVEYISEDSDWYKNGDTWTYTFDVFDDTLQYYLYEEPMEGYTSTAMDTYVIVNEDGTVTKTATITNRAELETGSLSIHKDVVGITTAQKFEFEIQLTGEFISGTQIFGNTIFINGVARVQIGAGETKVFDQIPIRTNYSITESTPINYEQTSENADGVIFANETAYSTFTNTYIPPERGKANLTLEKRIKGEYDIPGTYSFILQFSNLDANAVYLTSDPSITIMADANGNAVLPVTLAPDTSIQIIEVPIGTEYTISEEAGDYISSYEIEGAVSVIRSSNINSEENLSLSTATETVDENEENAIIRFTNILHKTSSLTLRKVIDGNTEETEPFEFTIQLSGMEPNSKLNSTVGQFRADEDGISEKIVRLMAGESVEISDLPVGIQYTISEASSKYVASYVITETVNGVSTTIAEMANTGPRKALATQIQTIHQDKDVEVVFTNSLEQPGAVTITKFDESGQKMTGVKIKLEYSIDNGTTWLAIQTNNEDPNKFPVGTSTSDGIVNGTLTTDANGSLTFKGLNIEEASHVRYRLVEVDSQGKALMKSPIEVVIPEVKTFTTLDQLNAFVELLKEKGTLETELLIDENTKTLTMNHIYHSIHNRPNITLPKTGGHGIMWYPFVGECLLFGLWMILYGRKKQQQL